MAIVSPDFETAFMNKLSAALPVSVIIAGATRNTWCGPVRLAGTTSTPPTPTPAIFIQSAGGPTDLHNDGRMVQHRIQVLIRYNRDDYAGGEALARAVHDAMDLVGSFVGPASEVYMDCRATSSGPEHLGPGEDDAEYFAEEFLLHAELLR